MQATYVCLSLSLSLSLCVSRADAHTQFHICLLPPRYAHTLTHTHTHFTRTDAALMSRMPSQWGRQGGADPAYAANVGVGVGAGGGPVAAAWNGKRRSTGVWRGTVWCGVG